MSHTFDHLGKTWTLYHKRPGDAHFYFSPRWGDRGQAKHHCLRDKTTGRALTLEESTAEARNYITVRFKDPTQYTKLRDQTKLRGSLNVGQLLDEWQLAGFPEADRRPRGKSQQKRQTELLPSLSKWWRSRLVSAIDGPMLGDYAEWRRAHCRKGCAGHRVTDCDLTLLSCCFDWAVAAGRADKNPFTDRPRFNTASDVVHCPAYMPASDEELHRITTYLLSSKEDIMIIAGAQLMFQALTGLRPGECDFLRWDATFRGSHPEPGHRYTVTLEDQKVQLLAVRRLKGGINPAVKVRPALAAFLEAWQPYSKDRWDSPYYFPDPDQPDRAYAKGHCLEKRLYRAVRALKLDERHPHAMRAFYVRVRRSQGADDGTIATELGQGSGAKMIVQIYGDARGIHGDGRFDWMPAEGPPAWDLLPAPPSNGVSL